ncbi:MAG TPA: hypothetical protein VJ747_15250 [Stellaceae bacterium]|nr:hypothetical protein [Stellaceae bacterium]
MRVGILELLVDAPYRGWPEYLYATYFRRQFSSIMPQAVAVWCRQLGHDVTYATYCGLQDPLTLLPDDLDVVFVSAYTQVSALAYALAKIFRKRGTLTVLGGPHAKSFPVDALRFFDLVAGDCDAALIDDIVKRRFDPPALISSGRPLAELPSVEERMPEIAAATFVRGRPVATSVVPMLASVGCPYTCNFCVDWDSKYVPFPPERLANDLRYLSQHWPKMLVAFHDPNFGVRFDETMDAMECVPEGRRTGYIMESSLSILKQSRLSRLKSTNCVYCAPGVESWADYSNKSGAQGEYGEEKFERVVAHFDELGHYVAGLQANFLFGADSDKGGDPAALTKEFIRRLPLVWPTINIPTPFGGTPLRDAYVASGRILKALPFAFYYNPYLAITIKHYDPVDYYTHLIDMHEVIVSMDMLRRRLLFRSRVLVRFVHALRTLAARSELAEFRRLRALLLADPVFRAFHEGTRDELPDYYHHRLDERLGRYAELFPRPERRPVLDGWPRVAAAANDAAMARGARSTRIAT